MLLVFGFKKMRDCVVAFKGSSYIGVLEKVCDFSDLWGFVCEVVHFVLILDFVSGAVLIILCCICCLNLIRMFPGKLLLYAIFIMVIHSLCWCSLLRGSVSILWM